MRTAIALLTAVLCISAVACSSDPGMTMMMMMPPQSDDATLSSLKISPGALSPTFSAQNKSYTVQIFSFADSVQVTATATNPSATIEINGMALQNGSAQAAVAVGMTTLTVMVRAPAGNTESYTVIVSRPQTASDYFKASNPGAFDLFGSSMSLSGDTLAVSAPAESSSATGVGGPQNNDSAMGSGAVYVFRRSGDTWMQEAYIKASNTNADDRFGVSISLSGDTLAVGASNESSNATGIGGIEGNNSAVAVGAVYIFLRTGSTWTQQAYIKASNTDAFDQFGASVSLSGDTLAVGAPSEASNATGVGGNQNDNSASTAGAAYVFRRSGNAWAQEAYLKASNTQAGDQFGRAVALFGDFIAVGAIAEDSRAIGVGGNQGDNGADFSGAAYVFRRIGNAWMQIAYLKASNTEANDSFGRSFAFSELGLVVGSSEDSRATGIGGNQADNGADGAGAAYFFR